MNESPSTILFLCTGNYYRSRFAEMLFNARAAELGLPWKADSRGLALERGANNHGPVAQCVIDLLKKHGHPIPEPLRFPIQLAIADLERFTRVIALKEAEHRPLLTERYPGWENRVEYWHIHDIDFATVEETLAGIKRETKRLIEEFQNPI